MSVSVEYRVLAPSRRSMRREEELPARAGRLWPIERALVEILRRENLGTRERGLVEVALMECRLLQRDA